MTPTANAMIGMSRTVAGDRTTEFEFLRIEKRGADLFYVPQPNGRPPVSFRLTSSESGRFVFENITGEDRVQRIEYRRDGESGLIARVEGTQDGASRSRSIPLPSAGNRRRPRSRPRVPWVFRWRTS
jgi:hypothetical protein